MATSLTPRLKIMLSATGCYFERQGKGDHEIWYSPLTDRRFVVDNAIKSRHTANGVLKQAGSLLKADVVNCNRISYFRAIWGNRGNPHRLRRNPKYC